MRTMILFTLGVLVLWSAAYWAGILPAVGQ